MTYDCRANLLHKMIITTLTCKFIDHAIVELVFRLMVWDTTSDIYLPMGVVKSV